MGAGRSCYTFASGGFPCFSHDLTAPKRIKQKKLNLCCLYRSLKPGIITLQDKPESWLQQRVSKLQLFHQWDIYILFKVMGFISTREKKEEVPATYCALIIISSHVWKTRFVFQHKYIFCSEFILIKLQPGNGLTSILTRIQ